MITITRKIQININSDNKEFRKECYEKLRKWNYLCFKAANLVSTHQFIQENIKSLFYLTEDTKVKLADNNKDVGGILTTSRDNTTYQVLSKNFKGEAPMNMMSSLNMTIVKTFKKESKEYFSGTRSLRSYKKEIPMPFGSSNMRNMTKCEDGNYTFDLFSIPFKTFFGRDLSGNQEIMDRGVRGDYKFCDSSIKFQGTKLFMLAVFQFEGQRAELNPESIMEARLSANVPIQIGVGSKSYDIGNAEEYLHRRIAIQGALRRAQIASRYNKGGQGREKKLRAIERFKEAEKNYIQTRIHQYSSKLVDLCVKMRCGKLVLKDQTEKESEAKADEFLLRNWTYYGMKEKIDYKCRKFGIELIVE